MLLNIFIVCCHNLYEAQALRTNSVHPFLTICEDKLPFVFVFSMCQMQGLAPVDSSLL